VTELLFKKCNRHNNIRVILIESC